MAKNFFSIFFFFRYHFARLGVKFQSCFTFTQLYANVYTSSFWQVLGQTINFQKVTRTFFCFKVCATFLHKKWQMTLCLKINRKSRIWNFRAKILVHNFQFTHFYFGAKIQNILFFGAKIQIILFIFLAGKFKSDNFGMFPLSFRN